MKIVMMILKARMRKHGMKIAVIEINCLLVGVIESISINKPNKAEQRKHEMNRSFYSYIPVYSSFTYQLPVCCWNISKAPVKRISRIMFLISIHVDLPSHAIFWKNEIVENISMQTHVRKQKAVCSIPSINSFIVLFYSTIFSPLISNLMIN